MINSMVADENVLMWDCMLIVDKVYGWVSEV